MRRECCDITDSIVKGQSIIHTYRGQICSAFIGSWSIGSNGWLQYTVITDDGEEECSCHLCSRCGERLIESLQLVRS